jgi:hypothetical protein
LPTALPIRPGAIVQEVIEATCPVLTTTEIPTSDEAVVDGYIVETPTPPASIVEDMLRFSPPDYTFWVREKVGTKKRFYYGPLPTTTDYKVANVEITPLGGDAATLRNRCVVSFTDYLGRQRSFVKTQSVSELNDVSLFVDAPFIREIHIPIGKIKGGSYEENLANAEIIADAALAEAVDPEQTGQFRVIGSQVQDFNTSTPIDFRLLVSGKKILIEDHGETWRIRRIEKALGTRMEAIISVGRGASRLDNIITRLELTEIR